MGFFKHKPQRQKPIGGGLIECYDCHELGHIAVYTDGYALPQGWVMAWVGVKPIFTCPRCGAKRREAALRMLQQEITKYRNKRR